MIDPRQSHTLAERAVAMLAEADPLRCVRILAENALNQPRGGRIALARIIVQSLAGADRSFIDSVVQELRRDCPVPALASRPAAPGVSPPSSVEHTSRPRRAPITQGTL